MCRKQTLICTKSDAKSVPRATRFRGKSFLVRGEAAVYNFGIESSGRTRENICMLVCDVSSFVSLLVYMQSEIYVRVYKPCKLRHTVCLYINRSISNTGLVSNNFAQYTGNGKERSDCFSFFLSFIHFRKDPILDKPNERALDRDSRLLKNTRNNTISIAIAPIVAIRVSMKF